MAQLRTLTLGTLALLSLATTACGHAGLPTGANLVARSTTHTLSVGGVTRNLGYNFKRYEAVFAPRAHKVTLNRQGVLPASVDNRQWASPIPTRASSVPAPPSRWPRACASTCSARTARPTPPSRPGSTTTSALTWAASTVNQDSGANLSDGQWVLQNLGCASEPSDPYNIAKFTVKPSSAANATAAAWKIKASREPRDVG